MSSERINGERPSTVEWGGGGPAEKLTGRFDMFATDRPLLRGAGFGLAVAGFVLLLISQVLPWMSYTTSFLEQDFPTGSGSRVELAYAELPMQTGFVELGWLALFAVVAVALVIGPAHRRIGVAAGLGLAAGQIALLVGLMYAISHASRLVTGRAVAGRTPEVPTAPGLGIYCALAAAVLLVGALLLAGGAGRRPVEPEYVLADDAEPDGLRPPSDLTVTPIQTDDASVWSDRDHR